MPISATRAARPAVATIAAVPGCAAATTSPIRSATRGLDRAEPAFGDGLARAGTTQARLAQHLPPGREHVGRGAGLGVDVPGPRLAAEQRDPVPQLGGPRPTSTRSPAATSIMPWSPVTYSGAPAGSAAASCSASLSTCVSWSHQASEPQPRGVPGAVQVAVVDGRPARGRPPAARPPPAAPALPACPPAGTRRRASRPGQRRYRRRPAGRPGSADPGGRGPLEDGGARLPAAAGPLRSSQRSPLSSRPVAGHGDLVAEHAVRAGRPAGAQRGQAGHRGGREPAVSGRPLPRRARPGTGRPPGGPAAAPSPGRPR